MTGWQLSVFQCPTSKVTSDIFKQKARLNTENEDYFLENADEIYSHKGEMVL